MPVELKRVEEFALLTLNRPEALNALSFAIVREIDAKFDEVAQMDVRGLLITGAGPKAFCAGADIAELAGRSIKDERAATEFGQMAFAKLDRLHVPSVALINGYAFGGGLELAMACTFRLAARTAKMGLPEIKLALVPGYGGTQRLPRLVGEGRAMEMILTGRTVDAEEAHRIGLVNRLVDGDIVEAGVVFAREFSGYSLTTLRYSREAVQRAGTALYEGFRAEADLSLLSMESADSKEGTKAFLEKRKPVFKDR